MQASAAGGRNLPEFLQNPKVLIAIISVAVIVIGVVIYFAFIRQPASSTQSTASSTQSTSSTTSALGPEMNVTGPPGTTVPTGAGTGTYTMPGTVPGGNSGALPQPAGQQGAASEKTEKPQSPGVPVRRNPFEENGELKAVEQSEPPISNGPAIVAPAHDIYAQLHHPAPVDTVSEDENEGPTPPPMRVSGVVLGSQVSAILQMGDKFMQITPGAMIPPENPVFRVARIEPEKVILTRRWEISGRKGVQRIEVTLRGGGATARMVSGVGTGVPGNGPATAAPGASIPIPGRQLPGGAPSPGATINPGVQGAPGQAPRRSGGGVRRRSR